MVERDFWPPALDHLNGGKNLQPGTLPKALDEIRRALEGRA